MKSFHQLPSELQRYSLFSYLDNSSLAAVNQANTSYQQLSSELLNSCKILSVKGEARGQTVAQLAMHVNVLLSYGHTQHAYNLVQDIICDQATGLDYFWLDYLDSHNNKAELSLNRLTSLQQMFATAFGASAYISEFLFRNLQEYASNKDKFMALKVLYGLFFALTGAPSSNLKAQLKLVNTYYSQRSQTAIAQTEGTVLFFDQPLAMCITNLKASFKLKPFIDLKTGQNIRNIQDIDYLAQTTAKYYLSQSLGQPHTLELALYSVEPALPATLPGPSL